MLDYLAELNEDVNEALKCELRVLQESSVRLSQCLVALAQSNVSESAMAQIAKSLTSHSPLSDAQLQQIHAAIRGLAVCDSLPMSSVAFINVSLFRLNGHLILSLFDTFSNL